MSTPLPTIRDRIATVVTAVTPSDDTGRTFRQWSERTRPSGASGHRAFVVRWVEGGERVANNVSEQTHTLELRVTYSTAGLRSQGQLFDAIVQDRSAVCLAIDRDVGWPSGTLHVATGRCEAESISEEETELVILISVELEES